MAANLIEFVLKSGDCERSLYISPVSLQGKELPSPVPPIKAYIYEDLKRIDLLDYFGKNRPEIPEELRKRRTIVDPDQVFEAAYLGNLIYCDKNKGWHYEENAISLQKEDIEQLELFMNSYKR